MRWVFQAANACSLWSNSAERLLVVTWNGTAEAGLSFSLLQVDGIVQWRITAVWEWMEKVGRVLAECC